MAQVARKHLSLAVDNGRRSLLREIADDDARTSRFFRDLTCIMLGFFGGVLAVALMAVGL